MRFLIILTAIVLLPVMMIAHLWDYTENHQSRLVQQVGTSSRTAACAAGQ